jgi:hypothetical protein
MKVYLFFIFFIIAIILLGACSRFSESIRDKTAGINGSFEYTKSGLPVNWLIYTPKTVPTGDFELIIDATEHKEGKQSLKFLVRECSPFGDRLSPGFCQEYKAIPGESYKVSFWVKNDGCEFSVIIGGVSASEGQYDTVVRSKETFSEWKRFEYDYTMPSEFKIIRFELNVLQPGTFWVDDIRIEGVSEFAHWR